MSANSIGETDALERSKTARGEQQSRGPSRQWPRAFQALAWYAPPSTANEVPVINDDRSAALFAHHARRRSPSELFNALMLSSGAMTNRIDRLERAGLVERRDDPHDRRGVQVVLTPRGKELVDRVVEAHVAAAERLLSTFSGELREQMAALLRELLRALDDRPAKSAERQQDQLAS